MGQAVLGTDDCVPTMVDAIDREHLGRMTFGDRNLACEVLELFDRQAESALARLNGGDMPAGMESAALAHALKGAASGVGAWGVLRAAQACERTASGSPAERSLALQDLALAVGEVRAEIARFLALA